jgi:molecular chaperone Hsp33
MSTQGNIRGVGLVATDLVREICELHEIQGYSAEALGEAIMGALLVASFCKTGERVNLNLQGSARLKQALVDASPDGHVRGYLVEREAISPTFNPVRADSTPAGPWGEGFLSVLRTKAGGKEQPYIGTVPLVTGHLAKDLTFYWVQSEQIPSSVGLAVKTENGKVTAAGGFLVQVLPGASPEEVKAVERHIHEIQSLAQSIAEHSNPTILLSQIFQSTAFMIVEEKPLQMRCQCSPEKVQKALVLIGVAELQSLLQEQGRAAVRCDFCTKDYSLEREELEALIQQAKK